MKSTGSKHIRTDAYEQRLVCLVEGCIGGSNLVDQRNQLVLQNRQRMDSYRK